MSTIHLMHGFIGFGKTTVAKQLETELPAIRFTHDEIMLTRYGRNPDDFMEKYKLVDEYIKSEIAKAISSGNNVIMDYGFWSKKSRADYFAWAKTLTPDVVFHAVQCDIKVAKARLLHRTKTNSDELFIDENCFNERLKQFEPLTENEGYPVIFHKNEDT